MKESLKLIFGIYLSIIFISLVSASCNLEVSMINQDPYPAVPGDYVKIVFQVKGVENAECGKVTFSLLEKYPLSFDPDTESTIEISAGTSTKDYQSFLMVPYKVRVDENALDGDNPIEVSFSNSISEDSYLTKQFDLNIEDVKANFEIFVKNYDYLTNILTFEILNIADSDIEALTLEIPKQEGIIIKGANKNILGDLDSNEYTTADFEAIPNEGNFQTTIYYTDKTGTRRTSEKTVSFDSSYFQERKSDQKATSKWTYVFFVALILFIIYYVRKRMKKKTEHHHKRHR
tara:strand:+ start:12084 stop:12950 length:867 start_codon:yes stop_codon:yes gene_type:complete